MELLFGIAFILFSLAQIYIIIILKRRKQKVGLRSAIVSFSLLFLLTLIVYFFNLKISYFIIFLSIVAIFLNAYVGYYLNYYVKSRVVDRYLHGYGTFSFTLLFFNVIILFIQKGGSKLFQSLFVLFLGIALGSMHEIVEFITDSKQNSMMQKGLRDTNFDTVFNVLGAVAAAAAAFFFII